MNRFISLLTILFGAVIFFSNAPVVLAGVMSPRDGYVLTPTGAGVPGVTVVEYSDLCPSEYVRSVTLPECPMPTNCHSERRTVTDATGHYFFTPMTPPQPADRCHDLNVWWRFTCSNPEVLYKVLPSEGQYVQGLEIVPNVLAATDTELCPPVQHLTSNIPQTITKDLTCNIKLACGKTCASRAECEGSFDGCNDCLPNAQGTGNICRKALACNSPCTTDFECAGAAEGCNTCMPNNAGTAKTCQKAPSCGSDCVRDDQCAGAASKDGCTSCAFDEGVGKKICQEPFDENACKCDGFDAVTLEYPSTKPFEFQAFAKVEGADITKAIVQSIQFKMSESDKNNPNAGTIVAQSPLYTPDIVSSDAQKVRFGAKWSMTPPQIKKDKMYRVFSEIKCKPKKRPLVVDASNPNDHQTKVLGLTDNELNTAKNDLQLKTLNFIKKGQTDNCKFLFFEYDQGIQ